MDPFKEFQKLFIIFAQSFLDHDSSVKALPPVSLNLFGSQVVADFLDFLFAEILIKIFELFLIDVPFASN